MMAEIAPLELAYADDAGEPDHRTNIRTQATYFSGTDGDSFLILMEDLTAYEVGDHTERANLERSQLAVDELAKLHAPFWENLEGLDVCEVQP